MTVDSVIDLMLGLLDSESKVLQKKQIKFIQSAKSKSNIARVKNILSNTIIGISIIFSSFYHSKVSLGPYLSSQSYPFPSPS